MNTKEEIYAKWDRFKKMMHNMLIEEHRPDLDKLYKLQQEDVLILIEQHKVKSNDDIKEIISSKMGFTCPEMKIMLLFLELQTVSQMH